MQNEDKIIDSSLVEEKRVKELIGESVKRKLRPGFHIVVVRPGVKRMPNERRGWMVWEIGWGSAHGVLNNIDCSDWDEDTFAKTKKRSFEIWKKSNSPFTEYAVKKVRVFRVEGDLSRRPVNGTYLCDCGEKLNIYGEYDFDRKWQEQRSGWMWLPDGRLNSHFCKKCVEARARTIRKTLLTYDSMGKVINRLKPARMN